MPRAMHHINNNQINLVRESLLLILTPRFVGLSDSLPKTSNIKMVDVWMLFSLVLPFLDVVLQTYSYLLSQGDEKDEVEREEDKRGTGLGLARVRVGVTTLAVSTNVKNPSR